MSSVSFFKKKRVSLKKLFPLKKISKDFLIENVRPLHLAKKNDLTFFDKTTYLSYATKLKLELALQLKVLRNI